MVIHQNTRPRSQPAQEKNNTQDALIESRLGLYIDSQLRGKNLRLQSPQGIDSQKVSYF